MTLLEAASIVIPIIVLFIGVSLLAYGLVAWCALDERRQRNDTRYVRTDRWN